MQDLLTDFLRSSQNVDGSWGYTRGSHGSLEPTVYATMALLGTEAGQKVIARSDNFIQARQAGSGGWPVNTTDNEPAAWVTALAGLALIALQAKTGADELAAEFLLHAFGKTRKSWILRVADWMQSLDPKWVDKNHGGWSWNPETATWVEPTSYAVLFLKRLRGSKPASSAKVSSETSRAMAIQEAESLLYDRMCKDGGWNYGNARVLGEELRPFPLTTAVALLALQDQAERSEVQASIRYFEKAVMEEKSALALCLACLCFDAYGRQTGHLLAQVEQLHRQTQFFGNIKTAAAALLALRTREGWNPFRLKQQEDKNSARAHEVDIRHRLGREA
jgi:hypothetical protein